MSTPSIPVTAKLQKALLLLSQARALELAGQLPQAVQAYQQAIGLHPQNPAGYDALMNLLLGINDLANVEKVLQAVPSEVYRQSTAVRFRAARLRIHQGRREEALTLLDELAKSDAIPKPTLYFNQAICHDFLGRLEECLPYYEKAHAAGLRDRELYQNWARVHQHLARIDSARKLYEEARQKFPQHAPLLYEYALFLLKNEEYREGFELYRNRWQSGLPEFVGCQAGLFGVPLWDGKTPVQRLLVASEQGIGDQIVMSALLPAMAQKIGHFTVALDPRLAPLLKRSWPQLDVLEHTLTADEAGQYDAYVPVADLGIHAAEGIGWQQGYLVPDKARAQALRAKYQAQFPGKTLVGLSWKSKRDLHGAIKSVDLLDWRDVLSRPDCQFISLQYGEVDEDLRRSREELGVDIHLDPAIDSFNDLDGLAAQVAALDLVITTSNSTAHIAAATGTPTWVALSMGPALLWYWGYRDVSAWYPHVRLFRCQRMGEWSPVLAAVNAALGEYLQSVSRQVENSLSRPGHAAD